MTTLAAGASLPLSPINMTDFSNSEPKVVFEMTKGYGLRLLPSSLGIVDERHNL